ncbi:S-type pyocin domain-containing protein [Pseudomonas brassicacearum]|uniref:HNH nuclease n=1 Tax=Pseudomonas brassicacearum subsp. neoaurantiaca TaxID=494916 RepID=A0A7V8RJZ4_9PSED|nr:S-type pyocin domain-containing protein [Pseudomonas brassicacearum]MBA1377879.1 HNH nuclease [Pseudomonas brassicacearum subsp. neoaurantiaca]
MPQEKNIRVTHGRPMTPSSSSNKGGGPGGPTGGGGSFYSGFEHGGFDSVEALVDITVTDTAKSAKKDYETKSRQLPRTIEKELTAAGLEGSPPSSSPVDTLTRELAVRHKLLARKAAELKQQTALANQFFGVDPLSKPVSEFHRKARAMERPIRPNGAAIKSWTASYKAAYEAKLLAQTIRLLNEQQAEMQKKLTAAQAQERARKAAQQLAAETARKAKETKEREALALRAEAQRLAQEQALRQAQLAGAFIIPGATAAAGPVLVPAGNNADTSPITSLAIRAALRAAVAMAVESLTALAGATLAGVGALLYSSKLANGELPERYALSTPLSELTPTQHHDLHAIAAIGGAVDLPVRLTSQAEADGQFEILVINTDGVTHPSTVRVVAVAYNKEQNLYTATTEDTPPRTLTWTPVVQPGNNSTTLPAEPPAPPVHTGASVTPIVGRIDPFPEITADSFDDYVFVFPIDSGLAPLYVMFRDRRQDPGVALGTGTPVTGIWTDAASIGEGAPISSQIADQLRGKEFRNFRKFRESFWRAVAADPILSQQFDQYNLELMKRGMSAIVIKSERVGSRSKYELHHKEYIHLGGEIYNIDNINVMTPKRHIETHREHKN